MKKFEIDEKCLQKIALDLGIEFNEAAACKIIDDALKHYAWIAEEAKKGNFIISAEADKNGAMVDNSLKVLSSKDVAHVRNNAHARKWGRGK